MNNGIFAVVKRYELEDNGNITTEFADWHYKPDDHHRIYNKLMELTNGNHELSSDAANWCQLATVGETYEADNWEVEIQEID